MAERMRKILGFVENVYFHGLLASFGSAAVVRERMEKQVQEGRKGQTITIW